MTEVVNQNTSATKPPANPQRRKKEKRNAQKYFSELSNDEDWLESANGSVCSRSSHISAIRVDFSREKPIETGLDGVPGIEKEGSQFPDHLSDLLANLAEVEKRGINILDSREDLADMAPFSNPPSPPPEQYTSSSSNSIDIIPPTSEQFTKDLMQSVQKFKAEKDPIASPPARSPVASPKPVRLPIKAKPVVEISCTSNDAVLLAALNEISKM